MAFGTTARGAIHVLGMMCEEMSKTGGFGLAGSHGVLILRGHGRDGILSTKLGRRPGRQNLGTHNGNWQWIGVIVTTILHLSLLRAEKGVKVRRRRVRST